MPLSAAYSLAVQHQSLWLLSGTEVGAINLQAVRHDEGKRITSLQKHTSAVSVMSLASDELSVLSGSWDKTILDWDLNTGQVRRSFLGSGGQISAIEIRPVSGIPIHTDSCNSQPRSATSFSSDARRARSSILGDPKDSNARRTSQDIFGSPTDSLFGGNGEGDSLFGDNENGGTGTAGFDEDNDNEFSRAIATDIQQQGQVDAKEDVDMVNGVSEELSSNDPTKPDGEQNAEGEGVIAQELPRTNTVPHNDDPLGTPASNFCPGPAPNQGVTSESTFLDASMDGTLRVWDRRQPNPVAKIIPQRSVPPWCMHASWSPDGNYIYAGRRNGTVDEYNIHKGLREPVRTLKFPPGSGAVSAVRAMPNSRHIVW